MADDQHGTDRHLPAPRIAEPEARLADLEPDSLGNASDHARSAVSTS